MKKTIIAFAFAIAAVPSAQAGTLTESFTSFYSFGDSLTDTGQFGTVDPPIVFDPSDDGRFSNGPTYAEYVAAAFESASRDTGNIALGGATAGNVNSRPAGPLSTFFGQISVFASALSTPFALPNRVDFSETEANPPKPGNNPLVSVLFGGNDFFQSSDRAEEAILAGDLVPADIPSFVLDLMREAANSVADGIRAIAALPNQSFDDFLVLDLPDVGGSPAFTNPIFSPPGMFDPSASGFATLATDAYNTQLATNVLDLINEGLNIISFDSSAVFDEILLDIQAGGPRYEITNGEGACTLSLSFDLPTCLDRGEDPNSYAFADGVHPSGAVHEILGGAVLSSLEQSVAPVPLPAGLPMALFALGALGWASRRRAA